MIVKSRSIFIDLLMGNSHTVLTHKQVTDLDINVYVLFNFDYDDYRRAYQIDIETDREETNDNQSGTLIREPEEYLEYKGARAVSKIILKRITEGKYLTLAALAVEIDQTLSAYERELKKFESAHAEYFANDENKPNEKER